MEPSAEKQHKPGQRNLLLLLIAGLLICVCVLLYDCGETKKGEEIYDDILKQATATGQPNVVRSPEPTPLPGNGTAESESGMMPGSTPTPETVPGIELPDHAGGEINLGAVREINEETVAWLYCPDTVIDYPIAQGSNNKYYVDHTLTGDYNKLGTLFLNAANAPYFTDQNSSIFGHRMKSGKMFGTLEQYKKQSYYDRHPTMVLYGGDGKSYLVELFAGYVSRNFTWSYQTNFDSEEAFLEFIQTVRELSTFESDVVVTGPDRILTLSTCTSEASNARYLVLGKLVRAE